MLSLNAAYVASVGVCDALEHTSSLAAHFGHHSHDHDDDHAHNDPQVNPDDAGQLASASDHHHNHVHPSFSIILPDIIGVTPLADGSALATTPLEAFVSALSPLPKRPPRATLA